MVIHPVLSEVYTYAGGIDSVSFIIYVVEVYALPQFCVSFWGGGCLWPN